jgi:hypothetical protein
LFSILAIPNRRVWPLERITVTIGFGAFLPSLSVGLTSSAASCRHSVLGLRFDAGDIVAVGLLSLILSA